MDYASIGRQAKAEIASFREAGIRARLNNPAARAFIHDVDVWTKFEEWPDHLVGVLVHRGKADTLKALGYSGPRSNSGNTVITLITAGIFKMKAALGGDKVMSSDGFVGENVEPGSSHWKPRLIKNETIVRETYCRAMDQLVLELLALS